MVAGDGVAGGGGGVGGVCESGCGGRAHKRGMRDGRGVVT